MLYLATLEEEKTERRDCGKIIYNKLYHQKQSNDNNPNYQYRNKERAEECFYNHCKIPYHSPR